MSDTMPVSELPYVTEPYAQATQHWPSEGRHVLAQVCTTASGEEAIIVYQAFNDVIGRYATLHKSFAGCPQFSSTRMTWVKTNFLWMQFRSSWGAKRNQHTTLAIYVKKECFLRWLGEGVHSSNGAQTRAHRRVRELERQADNETTDTNADTDEVKDDMGKSDSHSTKKKKFLGDGRRRQIVLQWDPDHLPDGRRCKYRRALQVGLKDVVEYCDGSAILDIRDVSAFVSNEAKKLSSRSSGSQAKAKSTQKKKNKSRRAASSDSDCSDDDEKHAQTESTAVGMMWGDLLVPRERVVDLPAELAAKVGVSPFLAPQRSAV